MLGITILQLYYWDVISPENDYGRAGQIPIINSLSGKLSYTAIKW